MRWIWLTLVMSNALVESAGAGELFVMRLAGKVMPERLAAVSAAEGGEVEICCREEGRVKAGTLLARVNPEELALEAAEMELLIAQRKLEMESEVLKLMRQKEEMDFILSLPEKSRLYVSRQMEVKADERTVKLLDQKMALAREQAQLSEQKMRTAFAKKAALRELHMPFDGRMQLNIPAPMEGERVPVTSGATLLTVADDSALYIAAPMTDPALAQLDTNRLSVHLEAVGRGTLEAKWAHRKVEKNGQSEALVYYYRVPEEARDYVWELLGSNLIVELWCRGDDDWRYEEKTALAQEAGEQAFETWEEVVAALRPGYAVVFSGETHLALRPQQGEP